MSCPWALSLARTLSLQAWIDRLHKYSTLYDMPKPKLTVSKLARSSRLLPLPTWMNRMTCFLWILGFIDGYMFTSKLTSCSVLFCQRFVIMPNRPVKGVLVKFHCLLYPLTVGASGTNGWLSVWLCWWNTCLLPRPMGMPIHLECTMICSISADKIPSFPYTGPN